MFVNRLGSSSMNDMRREGLRDVRERATGSRVLEGAEDYPPSQQLEKHLRAASYQALMAGHESTARVLSWRDGGRASQSVTMLLNVLRQSVKLGSGHAAPDSP